METLIGHVPDSWNKWLLGDVCEIIAGLSTNLLRAATVESSGVPVVSPKNIRGGRVATEGLDQIDSKAARSLSRYRLAPDDIVCSRTGELGRHALVGVEQAGWLLGTTCVLIRSEDDGLLAAYLNHYLSHPAVQDWIDRHGTASAIPSMSIKTLGMLPVIAPSTDIQASICEVLGALDEKIQVHDEISRITAGLRDALLPLLLTELAPTDGSHDA